MSVFTKENTEDVSGFLYKSVRDTEFVVTVEYDEFYSRLQGFFISVETFSQHAGSALPGEEFPAE